MTWRIEAVVVNLAAGLEEEVVEKIRIGEMSFQMSVRNQLCSWVTRYIQMLKILLLIVIKDTRKDLVGYQYMVLPKMKCALAMIL